jgi:hypothetical protein
VKAACGEVKYQQVCVFEIGLEIVLAMDLYEIFKVVVGDV